jgi:signal transduction histidine kinase
VPRCGVGAWARTYTAQAELLARLASQEPVLRAAPGAGDPGDVARARVEFARRFGHALAALGRPPAGTPAESPAGSPNGSDVVGAWVYDARGEPLAGWPLPPPTAPAGALSEARPGAAVVRTARRPGGVWADVAAPVADGPADAPVAAGAADAAPRGTVLVRVAVGDRSLPALNPTRPENHGGRTTVLARLGDSAVVVATASHDSVPLPRRAFALRELPPHVRAALAGRLSAGDGRGLFRPHVVYAATTLPEVGWVMVREMDVDFLLGQLTLPLAIEEAILATLAVLAAVVVVSRLRAAHARREGALAQLRADFVSGVSHELRTPLAQIRMFAELLRKRTLRDADEADRALRIIEKEAGRLAILVDNVLNYARLRREPVQRWITPVPAHVAGEARQVLESFAPLAAERGARIVLDVEEGPRAVIDPQALRQVLLNFLENAVKYGPRGQTVTLSAHGVDGAAAGRVPSGRVRPRVRIRVDDEGPGVPPAEREKIWEAFHRAESAVRSGVGGSGLGLAVVRDLVHQAGGHVAIESAPGGGARFVAELPMVPGPLGG